MYDLSGELGDVKKFREPNFPTEEQVKTAEVISDYQLGEVMSYQKPFSSQVIGRSIKTYF